MSIFRLREQLLQCTRNDWSDQFLQSHLEFDWTAKIVRLQRKINRLKRGISQRQAVRMHIKGGTAMQKSCNTHWYAETLKWKVSESHKSDILKPCKTFRFMKLKTLKIVWIIKFQSLKFYFSITSWFLYSFCDL